MKLERENEIQDPLEINDGDSPSVFGSNTSNGDGLEEVVVSDEEEYDIPTYMRRKNK